MAPKNSFRMTPMARSFFKHYEHKHQLMKKYLPTPTYQTDRPSDFSSDFATDFN